MPLVEATPSELMDIASLIRSGKIKSLEIRKRKSGKNKGTLMADYAIARPPKREAKTIQNSIDRLLRMSNPPKATPEQQQILHYRQRIATILEEAAKSMLAGDTVIFEISKVDDPEVERYTYILEVK